MRVYSRVQVLECPDESPPHVAQMLEGGTRHTGPAGASETERLMSLAPGLAFQMRFVAEGDLLTGFYVSGSKFCNDFALGNCRDV